MNEIQITTSFLRKKEDFKKSRKKFFIAGVIFTSILLFLFYQVRVIILTPVIAEPYFNEIQSETKLETSPKQTEFKPQNLSQQPIWLKLITDKTVAYFCDTINSTESFVWVINQLENCCEITSYSHQNQSWVVNATYNCDEGNFKGYEFDADSLRTFWLINDEVQTRDYPRHSNNKNSENVKIYKDETKEIQKSAENNIRPTKNTKFQNCKSIFRAEEDLQPRKFHDWKK